MAITTAIVGGGISAGGTALSAYAQVQAGQTNQKLADFNADQLDAQAVAATQEGDTAAARRKTEASLLVGSQRAAFSGQGIDINDGSAVDVTYDTLTARDNDVAQIKTNAALKAWGYRSEARLAHWQGQMAHRAGNLNAAGTVLTGVGSAIGKGSSF